MGDDIVYNPPRMETRLVRLSVTDIVQDIPICVMHIFSDARPRTRNLKPLRVFLGGWEVR